MSLLQALVVVVMVGASTLVEVSAGRVTSTPPPHTLEEAAHRLDMVLNNTRSRENYIRCFMDRGICNKDASSIKRILSDALATNCSNCTEIQRLGAERFFQYLQSRQPDTWVTLTDKYRGGGKGKRKHDDDDDTDDDDDDKEEKKGKKNSKEDSHSGGHQNHSNSHSNHTADVDPMMHTTPVNSSAISIIF